MVSFSEEHIDLLKREVEKKFGNEIRYSRDCNALSADIFQKTNRQLSVSTLKRFWNIVNREGNPSKYTLDTISLYCGHKDWEHYTGNSNNINHVASEWKTLQEKYHRISKINVTEIKNRIHFIYEQMPCRTSAKDTLIHFLSSEKSFTAFIAPGGYGKTATLAKISEKFWLHEKCIFPNDILFINDCSKYKFTGTATANPENDFIGSFFAYNPERNPGLTFDGLQEKIEGRFILALIGLDQLFQQKKDRNAFLKWLISLLARSDEFPWLKTIISCRPDSWQYIMNALSNRPGLTEKWFNVTFNDFYIENINIPLLNEDEINKMLRKADTRLCYDTLVYKNPQLSEIVQIPYFLRLFLALQEKKLPVTEINLLESFIQKEIFSGSGKLGKMKVINEFIKSTNFGLFGDSLHRETFVDAIEKNKQEFHELISYGILYEYEYHLTLTQSEVRIKFTHHILFEFFIIKKLLDEFELTDEIFHMIANMFADNHQFRNNLITWLIKFTFYFKREKVAGNLYRILYSIVKSEQTKNNFSVSLNEFSNQIKYTIRNSPEMAKKVLPVWAGSYLPRKLYFEQATDFDALNTILDNYLQNYIDHSLTDNSVLYGKSLQLISLIHKKKFREGLSILREIQKNPVEECPFSMKKSIIYYAGVIFRNYYFEERDDSHKKKLRETIKKCLNKNKQSHQNMLIFLYLIFDAYDLSDNYDEIKYVFEQFVDKWCSQIKGIETRLPYIFIRLYYAHALLKTGHKQQACSLFPDSAIDNLPFQVKNYLQIRFLLIRIQFSVYSNMKNNIRTDFDKVMKLSRIIRSDVLESKAKELKNKI